MPEMKLYYAPGSCSRAALIVLEESGAPYEAQVVAFMKGEHRRPEYLALNPKGKVPLLVVDGRPLSESLAIFVWLAETFPDAKLLPRAKDVLAYAKVLSDLAWTTSALHGLIGRYRFPMMVTDQVPAFASVRDIAAKSLEQSLALIDLRLDGQDWWHGEWSAQDAYLYWAWTRAVEGGLDASAFRHFAAHKDRMEARAATQRALAREAEGERDLAARGASLVVPE